MFKYVVSFLLVIHPFSVSASQQSLYFAFDEFKKPLGTFSLGSYNKNEAFLVIGYSDLVGDESYNAFLSRERAKAIRLKLISNHGVEPSKIKIFGSGEDHTFGRRNSEKRRVEIVRGTPEEVEALLVKNKEAFAKRMRALKSSQLKDSLSESDKTSAQDQEGSLSESYEETKSTGYQDRYALGLGIYNNILLATDRGSGKEAEWVSSENYSLEGQYQFKYKKFWFGLNASYHLQTYEVELNPIFTWNREVPNLLKASFVSDYETARWGLGFDVDYRQTSFIYEEGFNVELRDVFMLGVSLRAKYKWLATRNWSSRLGLTLDMPLSGSDDTSPKGELGYIGFIDLRRDKIFRNHGLDVKLYYGLRNYNNDQNDQSEEFAGVQISLRSFNWL